MPAAPAPSTAPAATAPLDAAKAQAAISKVVAALTKQYGAGTVQRLSEPGAYPDVKRVIPTGLPDLDAALGVGGLPHGKLIEIYGPEHCLKTTLAKRIAIACQQTGIVPLVVDRENAGAVSHDMALGLQGQNTLVSADPDMSFEKTAQMVLDFIDNMEQARIPSLVIFDSLPACLLQQEIDAELDDVDAPGHRAKFIGKFVRKVVGKLKTGDVGVILVNQLREKIGAMRWEKHTYTPGGRALRYYCHVRIEMGPAGQIGRTETRPATGMQVRAKVIKNKVGPPLREALLRYNFEPPQFITADTPPPRRTPVKAPAPTPHPADAED